MRSEAFWTWYDEFAAPRLREWPKMARDNTFRKMFEHLDAFDRPVHIVETGCIEDPDNWAGNGCSTILFNKYVETHPASTARSLEIVPEKIKLGKEYCRFVNFYLGDSVEHLRKLAEHRVIVEELAWRHSVDLLYLDASNHNWIHEAPSQAHHLNELMAAMPMLHNFSLVVVDDSIIVTDDYPQSKVVGKGGLVAQYALEVGAEYQFCEYQVGFTKITGGLPKTEEHISDLIARARKHVEAGNMIAADRLYRLIVMQTPPPWNGHARVARGEACANFGRNAYRLQKHGIAMEWFRDALVADPLAVDYRLEMANSLVALGALHIARREASIATHMEPENPRAWSTLGAVESDLLDEVACMEAYDKQIQFSEGDALADAILNRAAIGLDTKQYDLVPALCARLIDMGKRVGDAYHCLAMLEYRISNHDKALEYFDLAFANNVRNEPLAHWNQSLPLQSIGRLKESWEAHAWRAKEKTQQWLYLSSRRFNMPQWKGEPPPATIHVHVEAGHGDNIALLRYLPIMVERGYKVHYEADPRLLELVKYSMPQIECMPRSIDYPGALGLKPFDYQIPIGEIPHVFGTEIDSIPWNGPYLKADPNLSQRVATKVLLVKGRKIGLCWSSGVRKELSIWMEKYGRMKSMHYYELESMVRPAFMNGTNHFYSLQVGDGRNEQNNLVKDLLSPNPTWQETAALIDNLDLVITVDTGVAHLAAAMGKPTWVMMQRDGASWHFMCYREGASWNETSPWYPSVRIFRQREFNTPGYWKDVVDDVVNALAEEQTKCPIPSM
jgi:tetratricopeptide (TPR) repeat protein